MVSTSRFILGISGAPGTGKTTLAGWLHRKLSTIDLDCELLVEPARELAAQGVKIDQEMVASDYDAFIRAYAARDGSANGPLAIADRTPVDHFSYLAANDNLARRLIERHQRLAHEALDRYRQLVYLPIEFPIQADGFRVTSEQYRRALDTAICEMLADVSVPVTVISGNRNQRRRALLATVRQTWPELFVSQAGTAAGL
jgi:nicotinamide riboside kinase